MSKMLIVEKCRDCLNFMWDEGDTGQCCMIPSFFIDPEIIDSRCPLPDAPEQIELNGGSNGS